MNKNFQLHFWPQFGKTMVAVQSGDTKRYTMKERPRSREKPENVTMRLYSADHKISYPKDLDKSRGLKSQIDN